MRPSIRLFLLCACAAWLMLGGCHPDASKAASMPPGQARQLLTQLTSSNESERFKVQASSIRNMSAIARRDLETVLTSLRKKNVSTLIYVCIKTRDEVLFKLRPPAVMTLENAPGAFPNIAYYYARVRPAAGLEKLFGLYRRYPAQRLPICLALGEMDMAKASRFLLAEARRIKTAGGGVFAHLCGLKGAAGAVGPEDVIWMLEQNLDREEVVALAEVDVKLTDAQLKALWETGAAKRSYALECILGEPEAYFEMLCWVMNRYLDKGDADTVRQLLMSDSMRSSTARRVQQYRETVLKRIGPPRKSAK